MRWPRFHSRSKELERAEEMRAHLELLTEQLVERGRTPEEAAREARLTFGNPRVMLENVRDIDRAPLLETLMFDVHNAIRSLRAVPGFTAVVLAVLTLAMGATTALFSVVDAVALRRLPFPESDRIVAMDLTDKGHIRPVPLAALDFLALRGLDVFDGVAAVAPTSITLRRDSANAPEALRAERVSAEFFSILRVAPASGRGFTSENEMAGRDRVAVISNLLWQRRFGAMPDVIGKRLPAADGDIEVIGVMPRGFAYPVGATDATDIWVPYVVPDRERTNRMSAYLRPIARLRAGVTIDDAHARIDSLDLPISPKGVVTPGREGRLTLRPLLDSIVGNSRSGMLMLLAAVACVLLVALVNVANLLMVRASVRARELSVRTALGASRRAVARMLLTESLLLSIAGTGLGVLAAWWGAGALRAILPDGLPRAANVTLDLRVLGVSAALAIIVGLAFGLAPVWQSGVAIDQTLRARARTDTPTRRIQWFRASLLVTEVALAVVLLVGTSLFLSSFAQVTGVDVGLDYRNVLLVNLTKGDGATFARLAREVSTLPGVVAASVGRGSVPFSFSATSAPLSVPGQADAVPIRGVIANGVTADYFKTLGTRILQGRAFSATDEANGAGSVIILNESAAKKYFPGQDPLGEAVEFKGLRTVVGVVEDVRGFGPEQEADSQAFLPITQWDRVGGTLIVRTSGNPMAVASAVKARVWVTFPDLVIPPPQTLAGRYALYISNRRFNMVVLALFGVLGVTIAAVGIYGVMAYVVAQRTREIGVRMALGAGRATVIRSVLRQASIQIAVGGVIGMGMAWMLATTVQHELFQVAPHDLRLYALVGLILALAAVGAAYVPARRAARVDALVALRSE